MTGCSIINLRTLIETIGEDDVKAILSTFSCPLAKDVEKFINKNAILFALQGIAQTHLVFAPYKESPVLVGYFTLSNKIITVPAKSLSTATKKKLAKHSTLDDLVKTYCLSAPLIAQFGKNFTNGYNKMITGAELLREACKKVSRIQMDLGGRYAYLECEDKPALVQFYKDNGFWEFDRRYLDKDEIDDFSKDYLIQMIKYMD